MKNGFKRLLIIVTAAILTLSLFACDNGAKNKSLSNYDIKAVYNDTNQTLEVSMTVDYINQFDVELNKINFNLYPNAYRENAAVSPIEKKDEARAYPNGKSYGGIDIKSVSVGGEAVEHTICGKAKDNILSVPLTSALMPTDRVKVGIDFTLKVPNMRHRFGYHDGIVNLGNFYPIACMYQNGDFLDEPYYAIGDPFFSRVSNYNVSISVPEKFSVATTGAQSETVENGIKTVTASQENVRDFAACIGEFNSISSKTGDVTVSYYYKDDGASEMHLKSALDSIKFFSENFGNYPYKTFSVVKTPFLHGGMEYPGLVYVSSDLSGNLIDEVIIHEASHQWWYSMVGNDQINEAWLDEGLAEFSTSYFYLKNDSYGVKYNDRIADCLQGYLLYVDYFKDTLNSKMARNASEFSSNLEYNYMTYVKGQLMLDSLKSLIGESNLISGMKNYATSNAHGFGTKDSFISALEGTSKMKLADVVNSWVDGTVKLFGGK